MDRLQPPVEHTTHFDWPFSASKGKAQQARALARTEASFAATIPATVMTVPSPSTQSAQVQLRSPCIWPKAPVLSLRPRSPAAEEASKLLLPSAANGQQGQQRQDKWGMPQPGCNRHRSFEPSVFIPVAQNFHFCRPTLWLSADQLRDAEEMVSIWHLRPRERVLVSPSDQPARSNFEGETHEKPAVVSSIKMHSHSAGSQSSSAAFKSASPSKQLPAGPSVSRMFLPAPLVEKAETATRRGAAAFPEGSDASKVADCGPGRLASVNVATQQRGVSHYLGKKKDDRQSTTKSSVVSHQPSLGISPTTHSSTQSTRRLAQAEEETQMDLVVVEDLNHFVGYDARGSRGLTDVSTVPPTSFTETFIDRVAGGCLSREAAAIQADTAASARDKLASLQVDQEDKSFLRSSKYAAVARRILALIESRRFCQNNIPLEELSDFDRVLGPFNLAPLGSTLDKKGGAVLLFALLRQIALLWAKAVAFAKTCATPTSSA